MARFLIKPLKDVDYYVEYSTVVDAPVFGGNREAILQLPDVDEDRLHRTDRLGTSSFIKLYDWDQQYITVHNGINPSVKPEGAWFAQVSREKFQQFVESYVDGSGFRPAPGVVHWVYEEEDIIQ